MELPVPLLLPLLLLHTEALGEAVLQALALRVPEAQAEWDMALEAVLLTLGVRLEDVVTEGEEVALPLLLLVLLTLPLGEAVLHALALRVPEAQAERDFAPESVLLTLGVRLEDVVREGEGEVLPLLLPVLHPLPLKVPVLQALGLRELEAHAESERVQDAVLLTLGVGLGERVAVGDEDADTLGVGLDAGEPERPPVTLTSAVGDRLPLLLCVREALPHALVVGAWLGVVQALWDGVRGELWEGLPLVERLRVAHVLVLALREVKADAVG